MSDPPQSPDAPPPGESFFHRVEESIRALALRMAEGAAAGAGLEPGRTLGDFRLVRMLGRGGMGEVWEAEQLSLSRRVALKLLLAGRVSEKGVEYFAREARAGGRVRHPGIVSVYGTGTDEGTHWIAMELVEGGATLADFVDEMRAEPELPADYYPRVGEFIAKVADALEAAHTEGVIHRDLKPANVLVGPDDEPKVGDFGLARVVDEHSLSQTGDFAGTYYYMSPEQVMGRLIGIDQRTDVFSLGVVLYELLVLQRPFEGDTTQQIAEKIVIEDPPDICTLRSRVPEDLVVICGKALEKGREARYQSMAELAADLRRHLAHEPIQARAPSALHRARKWVRRNPTRSAVVAVVAVAFALISWLLVDKALTNKELVQKREELEGANLDLLQKHALLRDANAELAAKTFEAEQSTVEAERQTELARVSTEEARRQEQLAQASAAAARREQEEAARQRSVAQAVNDFLNEDLLKSVAPSVEVGKGRDVTMREVLDLAAMRIGARFEGQPEVEARIRTTIGQTYELLGEYSLAEEHQVRALDLRRQALGEDHQDTVIAMSLLASVLQELGRLEEAESLFREVLEQRRRTLGAEHLLSVESIFALGRLLMERGKLEEAEPYCREALALSRRLLGEDHERTMNALNTVANLSTIAGKLSEAEASWRQAVDIGRRTLEENDQSTLFAVQGLGECLMRQGRIGEAEPLLQESLRGLRLVLGDIHPETLKAISNMGALLTHRGEFAAAEPYTREALEVARSVLGDEHLETLVKQANLGTLLHHAGRLPEAESHLVDALAGFRRVIGDEHPHTLGALGSLGLLLRSQGRYEEAEAHSREALDTSRRVLGDEHPDTLDQLVGMANLLNVAGRYPEAETHYVEAVDGLRRVRGREHLSTGVAIYGLANCLKAQGRLEEAEGLARELVRDFPESSPYYPAFASLLQEMLSLRADAEGGGDG